MGTCRLCNAESILIDSHLIPKSAYKASKSFVQGSRPELVKVITSSGTAAYSDVQVTMKLLCKSCEDLFSRSGEKVLGRNWATASSFPLLEVLKATKPLAIGPEFSVYPTTAIGKSTLDSLFYFAISIFWRASVWNWGKNKDRYVGALGVKYEKNFRDFLLGREQLRNVYMIISVNTSGSLNGMITFPVMNKTAGAKFHIFDVLGIKFTIFVGGHIHKDILNPFVSSGSDTILITSSHEESRDFLELANMLQTKVSARGRLLRETMGNSSI